MVASNAARSAALRSAGMSGEVKNGRPTYWPAIKSRSTCRCSSFAARSSATGTSGRSAFFSRLNCTSTLICGSQFFWLFRLVHDQPQRPSTSLALHGEVDVVAARIAGDELDLGAEHVAQDQREGVRIGADRAAAEAELALEHVVPGFDRRGLPGGADAGLAGDGAEPGQFGRIEVGGR